MLFRNVQHEVIHTSGWVSDKSPNHHRGGGGAGRGFTRARRPPVARVGSGKEQRAEGNWMLLQDTKEKE